MNRTITILTFLVCCTLCPAIGWTQQIPNSQDTMSCGDGFVQIGDTEADVLEQCGEPTLREGDRWTYDRGPGRFLEILNFGEGVILSITQGPRE